MGGDYLLRRPKIFLLDEPLSNLDAQLRINVRLEQMRLHQQIRSTVLYVTHDQVEAMTLGDKVVVMNEGRVHQIDLPERIYDLPADTFVANFIGSPTMNLFKGKIVRAEGRLIFQGEDLSLYPEDIPMTLDGGGVEVGIRPEDIEFAHGSEKAFHAKVEMISNMGSEKYIHARLGSTILTVRVSKEVPFESGSTTALVLPPSKLHIFSNGRRI